MRHLLLLLVAACGGAHAPSLPLDASPTDGAGPLDAASADGPFGELCGNGLDDDGDGLVDEDCPPSLFAGVFAPTVATDPALAAIEGATQRPLAVLQTYHSTSPAGVVKIGPDLAAIFARGQIAHLNVEPDGYTPAQYAAPAQDPLAHDLAAMAAQVSGALAGSHGRVLLTFGAEMNGNWTTWGCLPAAQYIALYRAAHAAVDGALAASAIDPRRVRWAYGPNATASASCGSAAGYYPGADVVDLLGMSAYRADGTTVAQAVTDPMAALYTATGATQRYVVLQTGARAAADRDAWAHDLFAALRADPRAAGIIWFDAADWAVPTGGGGWTGLTAAIASAPVADRQLDGIFAPHFTDVAYGDAGFHEIQALADDRVTSGCGGGRFCPADLLHRRDAAILVARAFGIADATGAMFGDVPASDPAYGAISALVARGAIAGCTATTFCPDDPIREADLAAILVALGGLPVAASDASATRARAAVMLAHGARLAHATSF